MATPDLTEPIYQIVSSLSSSTPPPVPIMIRSDSCQSLGTPSLLTPSSSPEGSPNNSSGILRHVASTSNLASSISFAPLPVLEPRKRSSSAQLGVAARGQMLRNRRALLAQSIEEGDVEAEYYARQQAIWDNPQFRDPGLAEDAVEDAFIALGKMVKGAGKSLWRKMSLTQKSRSAKGALGEGESEEPPTKVVILHTQKPVLSSPSSSLSSSNEIASPVAMSSTPVLEKQAGDSSPMPFVDEPSEITDLTPKPPETVNENTESTHHISGSSSDESQATPTITVDEQTPPKIEEVEQDEELKTPTPSGSLASGTAGESVQATIISAPTSLPPPHHIPSTEDPSSPLASSGVSSAP